MSLPLFSMATINGRLEMFQVLLGQIADCNVKSEDYITFEPIVIMGYNFFCILDSKIYIHRCKFSKGYAIWSACVSTRDRNYLRGMQSGESDGHILQRGL